MYKRHSNENKVQIVINYFSSLQIKSKAAFCRINNVNPNTFNHWIKKYYKKTLTIDLRKNNHAKIKITEMFKKEVLNLIEEDGLQTIMQIRNKLIKKYNYSLATYYRAVHSINYTYKRVHHYTLPKNRKLETTLREIQEKQKTLSSIGIKNVVSIDEVPFYQEMYPLYGWSPKGKKLKIRRLSMRSKHYSLLCAMSSAGQFSYKIVTSGNEIEFKNFLTEQVIKKFKNHTHFLMDNARIHHCKKTVEYIKKNGKTPIYTVPYTPELNPIESSFSVIKNYVRQNQPKTEIQLKDAIKKGIKLLTREKCTNMFKNSFGLTDYKIIR